MMRIKNYLIAAVVCLILIKPAEAQVFQLLAEGSYLEVMSVEAADKYRKGTHPEDLRLAARSIAEQLCRKQGFKYHSYEAKYIKEYPKGAPVRQYVFTGISCEEELKDGCESTTSSVTPEIKADLETLNKIVALLTGYDRE